MRRRLRPQGERRGFGRMMVNALGQRVAPLEAMHEAFGQRLDDTDLQRQPSIGDAIGERPRLIEQRAGASGQARDHRAKRRRGLSIGERFHRQAVCAERIERHIDPVELAIVLGAILEMVDDLQRCAQRVVQRATAPCDSPCRSSTKRPTGAAE